MERGSTIAPALELASRAARGRGAVDLALGDHLALLQLGDRALQLGYANIGDYAREVLDLRASHAYDLARLARDLWRTPRLREAVHAGSVSIEKAALVVGAATAGDEAGWVVRAASWSIRRLRAALGRAAVEPEEAFEREILQLDETQAILYGAAMQVAAIVLDRPDPSRWDCLAAIAAEGVSGVGPFAHQRAPGPGASDEAPLDLGTPDVIADGSLGALAGLGLEVLETAPEGVAAGPLPLILGWEGVARLNEEMARWEHLTRLMPVPLDYAPSAEELDASLRELARLRAGWDELMGRLCRMIEEIGLWRGAGFGSWAEYCDGALGMKERTVRERVGLEHRLDRLPELREAYRAGGLGYEKVRMLSFVATRETTAAWVERAIPLTVIELRRAIDEDESRQISGTGRLEVRGPRSVLELLHEAFMLVRSVAGRWLSAGQCLAELCNHFLDVWWEEAERRMKQAGGVRLRDRGRCQVRGCSGPGSHAHHIDPRSQGGSNADENLVSLCPPHHLHGAHRGYLRVEGLAPDRLRWWLGRRAVAQSRMAWHGCDAIVW